MSVAYGHCYSNGSLFKFSDSLINCTRPSIQLHHRQPSAQRSRGSVQAVPSAFQSKPAKRVDPHTDGVDRGSAQPIDEYRRSTGICLVNRQGLVFAARRVDDPHGTWQMPQGGIDYLENPMVAAVRELHEETGIRSARIVAAKDSWLSYDSPTCTRSQFTGGWVRYKGQTQKWFLMSFYGTEAEVDLERHGVQEFSEYRWLPLEVIPSQVVSFKQGVYTEVHREFGPIIDSMKASWRSIAYAHIPILTTRQVVSIT